MSVLYNFISKTAIVIYALLSVFGVPSKKCNSFLLFFPNAAKAKVIPRKKTH